MAKHRRDCQILRRVNFPLYRSLGIVILAPNMQEIRSALGTFDVPVDSQVCLLVRLGADRDLRWLGVMRPDDLHAISFAGDKQLNDHELASLFGMTGLRELNLRDTSVTDVAVIYMQEFAGLERLDLRGTLVSNMAIAQLRQSLPGCTVTCDCVDLS